MKRFLLVFFLLAGILALQLTASSAVDSTDILIKVLVDKGIITEDDASSVRAEIATIRQDEEAARKSFNVSSKRPIKLSGYLQERYTHSTKASDNDSVEAKRVRLSLGGEATEQVDLKVQVDFAGSRKGVSGVDFSADKTSTSQFGKPTLLDAVIGYKLAGDSRINIGQFKIPFSLENLTSSTYLDLINRSQVVEALVPGRDIGAQGRDIGVQYSGLRSFNEDGSRQLEYYAAVFNGSGINTGDENDRKDPAVRLVYRPGLEGFALGVSHYHGALGQARTDHVRTGGEAVFAHGPWALKSEYIWGNDGQVDKKGWYATLVGTINPVFQGVVRFDRLDPNVNASNDGVKTMTAGINYLLNKDGYSRWQLNYERRREEGPQVANDQILAQFQAGF